MPRRAYLHEHRNDHQIRTTSHLMELGCINAVFDEEELLIKLNGIKEISFNNYALPKKLPQLLKSIQDFINNE
jgi:hypothetical protein